MENVGHNIKYTLGVFVRDHHEHTPTRTTSECFVESRDHWGHHEHTATGASVLLYQENIVDIMKTQLQGLVFCIGGRVGTS